MKKYLWLLLALALLLAISVPLAVSAKNGPPDDPPGNNDQGNQGTTDTVYLHNIGTIPQEGGSWHFVLNGLTLNETLSENCIPELHIFWENEGNPGVVVGSDVIKATNIHNKQLSFFVPYKEGWIPIIDSCSDNRTHAYIPSCGGSAACNSVLTASLPTAPVPEATPIVLLGLGMAGLGTFIVIKHKNLKSGIAS